MRWWHVLRSCEQCSLSGSCGHNYGQKASQENKCHGLEGSRPRWSKGKILLLLPSCNKRQRPGCAFWPFLLPFFCVLLCGVLAEGKKGQSGPSLNHKILFTWNVHCGKFGTQYLSAVDGVFTDCMSLEESMHDSTNSLCLCTNTLETDQVF